MYGKLRDRVVGVGGGYRLDMQLIDKTLPREMFDFLFMLYPNLSSATGSIK